MKNNLRKIIDELKEALELPHDVNDPYEKGCDDTTINQIKKLKSYEEKLRSRLETLKNDVVKYKNCEFNAPKVRRGMIMQLEEILGDET
ncbi:unnamed protein product [marine sediment metagenome]|uniref:Uncharacterized protein n=1 Tax=marine sediment metagenome TaxID=412755 RepID=X0YF14_9ZZZZ